MMEKKEKAALGLKCCREWGQEKEACADCPYDELETNCLTELHRITP